MIMRIDGLKNKCSSYEQKWRSGMREAGRYSLGWNNDWMNCLPRSVVPPGNNDDKKAS